MVVDVPTKDAKGEALSIEQCLRQAITSRPKRDPEEAKQEETAEVAEPEPAEEEPALPQYETHAFAKPQIGKDKSAEPEQKDPEADEAIQVALLKFDDEQAALRYLVSAAQRKTSLNLLSGVDIARILDPRYRALNWALKQKPAGASQIEGLEQLVPELVRVVETSTLISAGRRAAILKYTGLSEAASADDEEPLLRELLSKLKTKEAKIEESELKQAEDNAEEEAAPGIQAVYLPSSDQVLLARDNELKLSMRPASGVGEFFSDPASVHFGNRLKDLMDEVRLFITPGEVRTIGRVLDVGKVEEKKIARLLLARLEDSCDGSSVMVPYFEALLAVKAMVRAAIS